MQKISIISIGKTKEKWQRDALAEYQKRISGFAKLEIYELAEAKLPDNPNVAQINTALENEARDIIKKISTLGKAEICALCIEGKPYSSEQLAELMHRNTLSSGHLILIIGSSHGLADSIKQLSSIKISMSQMTFPHILARILLTEQIYRALCINNGKKYHK